MRTLLRLFTLKPYGNDLVDGMARLWMLLAAVNIVSIALCDAIAWGYFGYTTAHGYGAYVAAALAGVIVFTLVGSLDAMFVMHDRSYRQAQGIRRDHIALGARIVLVILTFTVTAPFLTQLFFARDIEASIRRSNESRVAARRAQITNALTARQHDLEKEIAGAGASGRYGKGPTAAAIEREIVALQNEVRTFDTASPELLASRYGVDLVREGPDTRARAVEELSKSPSFRSTQLAIKAFLLFMFLGLVCLKLFQPDSVRIYYSAQLQAGYARLKAGLFNHRLDPREHVTGGGMTPVRFAEWFEHDQQVRELTERLAAQEDAVRVLQETVRLDVARMHDELATASRTIDDLEAQVVAKQHELNVLTSRIADEQQQLDDFKYDFGDDLSLRDQQLLISTRNKTARSLADHRASAAVLTASLSRLTQRLEGNRSYERQLREALEAAGSEAASLMAALQKARQRRVAELQLS